MSIYPQLYNGQVGVVWNPSDFYQTQYINSLQTDSTTSNAIISNAMKIIDPDSGDHVDVATQAELEQGLQDLKDEILGGAGSAFDTLKELQDALSSNPDAYATLVTSIATKAPIASPSFSGTVSGISKSMVGLGNCDNTSDANKPVSTAQQTALNLKANQSSLNTTNTNVSALQAATSCLTYNSGTNTSTLNDKLVVTGSISDNGSMTIGDGINNDTLTVNAATTFNSTVSGLTKSMVGLGNCDNTSDVNKPVSTAQQTALDLKANLASPSFSGTVSGITKSMVGLGNCDNTSDANKPVSTAQQTALDLKANLASPSFSGTVSGISKSMVGLGNCDNTSDANKPVSTAQQTALNLKANQSSLDTTNSNVSALQTATSCLTYNSGTNTSTLNDKLVVTGSISNNGSMTIGDGINNDTLTVNAATTFNSTVSGLTKSMVGLGNCDNTSDVNKPVSTAQQTALDLKANLASPSFSGTVSGITKSMVGLGNCDNTSDANKPVSTAQQTALDLKANLASPSFSGTVSGITKSMVSLGNCDNTSDANKPVSTATQTALDLKANLASPSFSGTVSGITKSMVSLGNCDNTSDVNKPVSTATQTALDAKAADNAVVHLSSTESITGTKSINLFNESINYVSGITTSVSLDYSSGCKGINLLATPSANYSVALTNVPTSSTNAVYSVTLLHTSKYYCSSITINGTSRSLYAGSGQSNITINASASYVLSQLNVCFLNSSTPIVIQNVLSIW